MVSLEAFKKLAKCFNGSYLNDRCEFVAHAKGFQSFRFDVCQTELEVRCKVLEWFSRATFLTEPFKTKKLNDEFHSFMLNGVNAYLGTNFSVEDMDKIYWRLGNEICREKTKQFVLSGYDMSVLWWTKQ